jgi:hypothetical protein
MNAEAPHAVVDSWVALAPGGAADIFGASDAAISPSTVATSDQSAANSSNVAVPDRAADRARTPAPDRSVIGPSNFAVPDRTPRGNVLAVLDGTRDEAAVSLAVALARESAVLVDLLLLVEVPAGLPMEGYGEWLLANDGAACLLDAERLCGPILGESSIQLCRSIGPAIVDEARARHASSLVIGAPGPGWWTHRRARRAIAHAQARADCRVYVTHAPAPPAAYAATSRRHTFG